MFKELLGEAFPIIEKVAPLVASLVGSPIAGIASTVAISALGKAFGVSSSDVAQISQAITADPDGCSGKLANLESQFAEWFQNGATSLKMPSAVEVNVKMNWNNNGNGQP